MPRPASATAQRRGRSSRRRSDAGGNAWLTTYADAVTLLLAFFVLLYAMSEVDVAKFTAFLEGLSGPFGNESSYGLLPETDGLQPEEPPTQSETHPPDLPDHVEVAAPEERDQREADREAREQLEHVGAAIDEALTEQGLEDLIEQRHEERGLVVSVASDDVLFELGSTHINDTGRRVIDVVADTLEGYPNPLLIEGHTDDVPLHREDYTNWNLSTDRAVAVLSLLIEEHGLPPDRVGAAGYGRFRPLADNATADGRARNRRVDIVVLLDERTPGE